MQMAAELDRALYTVNLEMQEAYKGFLKVKTELDMLKSEKTTIIERSRLISRMLSKFWGIATTSGLTFGPNKMLKKSARSVPSFTYLITLCAPMDLQPFWAFCVLTDVLSISM